MIDKGKQSVLGVLVDAVDYEASVDRIRAAALAREGHTTTALAVHGVMTGVEDSEHRARLNGFDLTTPDGQPVRWALEWLQGQSLPGRVYGPELMARVCAMAEREGLPVYLYGSSPEILAGVRDWLARRHPALEVAGSAPSRFRTTTADEQAEIAETIRTSGARICFVGLGCPRQEIFAHEYRDLVGMPLVAVGAAFDYHAGHLREPPDWMMRVGLQWLHRLAQDPRRLWYRYTVLNARYMLALSAQRLGFRHYRADTDRREPTAVRWG